MGRWGILAAAAALLAAPLAGAPSGPAPSLTEQRQRLARAKADAERAQARSAALQRRAAAERDEARRARAEEAAMAARIQAAEADIEAARARVAITERLLRAERVRLAERQAPVLRLIAALQSFSRRPAVLGLVQPGSTEDIVHVRAVLGTITPVVEARTADVRNDLARARSLRRSAELAVESLREGRRRLEADRLALVRLEAEHRLRSRDLDRSAMVESDRAIALGERARDIVDLMETMGQAAATGADLAELPGPLPRPHDPAGAGAPRERSAGSAGRAPPYRLPVAGRVIAGLGEVSPAGVRSRGLTLAVRPDAQLVAPTGGRVIFAGGFRGYGNIVIIDHGQGWTSLVTGMGSVAVKVGDRLVQGSPIGRAAGGDDPRVTVELRRRGRPVDMTPLLG